MPDASPPNGSPTPPTLNHVIGQSNVVAKLRVALEASFADSKPFPHTLLLGSAGLGKTTLAKLIATELAAEFHEGLGQTLGKPGALNGFLLKPAKDGCVLFIDEAHELPALCQTCLYRAMEEGVVFLRNKDSDATTRLQTVKFTLIAATTDPQRLLPPLRDRFRLTCELQPYSVEQLVSILRQRVRQLGWAMDEGCLAPIAQRSFGTPRLALRLAESAHRTARSEGSPTILVEHLERTLVLEQQDDLGLGPDETRYLTILLEAASPMRLSVLAAKLRVAPQTVAKVIEERLVACDLIERTQTGRSLTPKGIEHVRRQRQAGVSA